MHRVVVINGHPDQNRLITALEAAYVAGMQTEGKITLEQYHLGSLQFDPVLRYGYAKRTSLEPDLVQLMEAIMAADHVVWIYPTWWGGPPALLKGLFDRIFLPGFFFQYHEDGPFWDKYMKGKSSRVITTMDSPRWWDRLAYGRPGYHMVKRNILNFVGFKTRFSILGGVRSSSPAQRERWMQKVSRLGRQDFRRLPKQQTGRPAAAQGLMGALSVQKPAEIRQTSAGASGA